ncbi:N-acetylglucosamine repressor [Frondihabitans sp. 762G35]|nr:N-acetylglucosamine repressor [Frondihabitans sp. 762G35]
MERAMNSPQVLRRINSEAVLRFALAKSAFGASEAMEATGLTRSTVISLCEGLIELGWLEKLPNARTSGGGEYSKGRPAGRYRLRETSGHLVGIDAGQHTVTAVVADLRGKVLARETAALADDGLDPALRLEAAARTVHDALASCGVDASTVHATVIGVPAPVDLEGRSPDGHEHYWATMNPGFADALPGLGRIVVDNDANLAATAERTLGAGVTSTSFAALLSGERFGAGLIVDDVLIRGRHGGAGEMRALDLVEGVGSAAGLAALARDWAQEERLVGAIPPTSPLARMPLAELTAARVFEAAEAGDPGSIVIVRRLGERLARICLVLASLLDVERIVLVGALAASAGGVLEEARAVLRDEFYPPVPELVASPLGADAVVLGAVARGLGLVRAEPLAFVPAGAAAGAAAPAAAPAPARARARA